MRYLAIECPAARGTWSCHPHVQGDGPATKAYGTDRYATVYEAALGAADVLVAADLDTWEAYEVPGDHKDAGAASAAWAAVRMGDTDPKPIARGQYRYDADGVAPVSVGVVMLEGGR